MINPFGFSPSISGTFDMSAELCWISYWPAMPVVIDLEGTFTIDELKALVETMTAVAEARA